MFIIITNIRIVSEYLMSIQKNAQLTIVNNILVCVILHKKLLYSILRHLKHEDIMHNRPQAMLRGECMCSPLSINKPHLKIKHFIVA